MNPVLAQVYGLDKTASEEDGQVTLNDISAEDLLTAHEAGELDINDFLAAAAEEEPEKTAGFDFSQFSEEELYEALSELESDGTQKLASEEQYWDAAGRQMARGYADELTKQASTETPMDLNELSAEEIIGLAYELADEMDKTASDYEEDYDDDDVDLNAFTPDEIIELAYHLQNDDGESMEKEAGYYDLNEFSVDEFMDLAGDLEVEFIKEANIKHWLARQAGRVSKSTRAFQKKHGPSRMEQLRSAGGRGVSSAKARAAAAQAGVSGHYKRRWARGGERGSKALQAHLERRAGKGKKQYSEKALQRLRRAQQAGGRAAEFSPEALGVAAAGGGTYALNKRRR